MQTPLRHFLRDRPEGSGREWRTRSPIGALLCIVGLLLLLGPEWAARAQGTAQVQFMGVPPQLSSVQVGTIERNYRAGQYPVQFVYNDPSGRAATFRFRFTVEYNGTVVLETTSEPTTVQPGVYVYRTFRDAPQVRFPIGARELLNDLDPSLQRRINKTGRLPEGEYVFTLDARPVDPNRLISSVPGRATASVRIAQPPTLVYPADGALVTEATPQFSWSPATGLPDGTMSAYTLRVVEMSPGQTPLQALRSNIPHVETVITGTTTFAYLPNELPLENGHRYAWQISARAATGSIPFAENGETEIYTFTYGEHGRERYVWHYPSAEDPLIEVPISEYAEGQEGLTVSGVYSGTVKGETISADFGSEGDAAVFRVEGTPPNAELTLKAGVVKLSNGMTITP